MKIESFRQLVNEGTDRQMDRHRMPLLELLTEPKQETLDDVYQFTDLFRTGIDEKVTEAGDQLAGVIGKRNVDKLGDIVMTSFGYSDSETCLCCPCLPASQVIMFNVL